MFKETFLKLIHGGYFLDNSEANEKFEKQLSKLMELEALAYQDSRMAIFHYKETVVMVWTSVFPIFYGYCWNYNLTDVLQYKLGISYSMRYKLRKYLKDRAYLPVLDKQELNQLVSKIKNQKTNDTTLIFNEL